MWSSTVTQVVYLLHFERRLPTPGRPQHYVGVSRHLFDRIKEHEKGHGSKLCKVAKMLGVSFTMVKVWDGDEKLERRMKKEGHLERHCYRCSPPSARLVKQEFAS